MPWQNQTPDALGEERSRTIKSLEGAEGQVKKNKRSCEAEALRLPGGGELSDSQSVRRSRCNLQGAPSDVGGWDTAAPWRREKQPQRTLRNADSSRLRSWVQVLPG